MSKDETIAQKDAEETKLKEYSKSIFRKSEAFHPRAVKINPDIDSTIFGKRPDKKTPFDCDKNEASA